MARRVHRSKGQRAHHVAQQIEGRIDAVIAGREAKEAARAKYREFFKKGTVWIFDRATKAHYLAWNGGIRVDGGIFITDLSGRRKRVCDVIPRKFAARPPLGGYPTKAQFDLVARWKEAATRRHKIRGRNQPREYVA